MRDNVFKAAWIVSQHARTRHYSVATKATAAAATDAMVMRSRLRSVQYG